MADAIGARVELGVGLPRLTGDEGEAVRACRGHHLEHVRQWDRPSGAGHALITPAAANAAMRLSSTPQSRNASGEPLAVRGLIDVVPRRAGGEVVRAARAALS